VTVKKSKGFGRGFQIVNGLWEINETQVDHNLLYNYVANRHIDWTQATEDLYTTGDLTVDGDVNFNGGISGVGVIAFNVVKSNGFSIGDVVRYKNSSYVAANCKTEEGAETIGLVTEASSSAFKVTIAGYVDISTISLDDNTVYYLSESNGQLTKIKPLKIGYISKPILVTLSSGLALVLGYRGIVQEQIINQHVDTTSDVKFNSLELTEGLTTVDVDISNDLSVIGIATLGDGSTLVTSAAPTTDAMIANKKYVDDITYWERTGTKLFTATAADDIEVTGNIFLDTTEDKYIKGDSW